MKKLIKKIAIGLTAVLMTVGLTACGGEKQDTTSAGGAATGGAETAGGQIVFGTNAEFPPFEFVAGSGTIDQYDGIDIAIAKQVFIFKWIRIVI